MPQPVLALCCPLEAGEEDLIGGSGQFLGNSSWVTWELEVLHKADTDLQKILGDWVDSVAGGNTPVVCCPHSPPL